jgi:hypothetical protein
VSTFTTEVPVTRGSTVTVDQLPPYADELGTVNVQVPNGSATSVLPAPEKVATVYEWPLGQPLSAS